jgi:small-conductance mechanosensitive channel
MNQTNPAVKYGMIGAIILVVFGVAMQFIVLNALKKAAENPAQFSPLKVAGFSILTLLLIAGVYIFCIVKSMKDYRNLNPDYTYNNLVKQGLLATLIIGVVSSLFSYLYGYVIAPESREQTIELTKRIYEGMSQLSDDQREKMINQMENQDPIRQAITGLSITLALGLITSLISASVLKKKYNLNDPNQMR